MPGGSENHIFEKPDGEVFMVVWNNQAKEEILYLGDNIRLVDIWGRSKIPKQQEHRQIIPVGSLPKFILGLSRQVAAWQMNTRFAQNHRIIVEQ